MSGSIGGVGPQSDFGAVGSDEAEAAPAPAPVEGQVVRGSSPAGPAAPAAPREPRLDALVKAFHGEPADKLEKTIATAKKQDPTLFRTAVREYFKDIGFEPKKLTAHLMAMDANNDGKLTFSESYKTMHDMGFSRTRAFMLSGLTATLLPLQANEKFSFKVDIAGAEKTERPFFKTGFDTKEEIDGRLDEIMGEDLDKDGFVTQKDIDRMIDKRTSKMDSKLQARIFNYLNKGEWQALLQMMDGNKISRDELRDFYNSSLFFSFLEPDNLAKKLVAYRGGVQ